MYPAAPVTTEIGAPAMREEPSSVVGTGPYGTASGSARPGRASTTLS
jgi:hypothetical protein